MPYVIKLRRDTAANWTSANTVLAAGESGYETDTNKLKIGDGTTAWNSLGYITATASADIANATFWDAKGDLAVGTGSNTANRLPVGTNDQALVANSATTEGVEWQNIVNSLTGTANEVEVNASTGDITIGLPNEVTVVDLNTEQIDFDLTPAGTVQQGRMIWDATNSILEYGMTTNVVNRIGAQLYKFCRNDTGSTLNKGQIVYVSGSHADIQLKVSLAQANAEATSAQTVGVVAESISNNSSGFIQTFGSLEGITTTGYTAGEPIYLSETTAGGFRSGIPTAPNHGVRVGFIVKVAGGGAGSIFVNIQNYQELEELSDVQVTSKTTNDFLVYDTNKWVNKTAANSRTALGLGTLATQSGTFSGTSSGTNTGDQNIFQTIAVAGQSNVVADSTTDTLTFIAGTGMTITTNATNDEITFTSSGGGGTPGGSDTQVQFNDGGSALGGDAGFTYVKATDALTVAGSVTTGEVVVTNQGLVKLNEGTGGGTNYVGLKAPSTLANNNEYTFPNAVGAEGQALTIDTVSTNNATLKWTTPNDVYAVFTALNNIAPASNMATLSTLNDLLVLDFDTGTAESAVFTGVLPNNADLTNGLSVIVHWTANNTTSASTVEWKWEIASLASGNVTSRSYDTATVESKTYGTTTAYTVVTTTRTIANADTDGLAAGDAFAIKLTRNVTGTDDMGVDAKFIAMEVRKA